MIRSNLAILLAERNLKITRVSMDTGISRTTLTALCNNYSQGIQFDTLNELCHYLDVAVEELISFAPVDVRITDTTLSAYTEPGRRKLGIFADIRDRRREQPACYLQGDLTEHAEDQTIKYINIAIGIPAGKRESGKESQWIKEAFQRLPRRFFPELERSLEEHLRKLYPAGELAEKLRISFLWSGDLIRKSKK